MVVIMVMVMVVVVAAAVMVLVMKMMIIMIIMIIMIMKWMNQHMWFLDVASSIQDINYTKHGISRNNQWKTRGICKQTRGFKLTGQQGELKQHGEVIVQQLLCKFVNQVNHKVATHDWLWLPHYILHLGPGGSVGFCSSIFYLSRYIAKHNAWETSSALPVSIFADRKKQGCCRNTTLRKVVCISQVGNVKVRCQECQGCQEEFKNGPCHVW